MNKRLLLALSISILVFIILFATVILPKVGLKGALGAIVFILVISGVAVFMRKAF